jgi:acyl-CoA thioester hydrolase
VEPYEVVHYHLPIGRAIINAINFVTTTSLFQDYTDFPRSHWRTEMASVFQYTHTVTPDEIDSQQHVHNLRYLQWTLWAAHAHSAAGGWDAKEALGRGIGWVVRSHDVTYRAAAFAGDELIVQTWVSELTSVTLNRRYLILRPHDKQILARAMTRWAFVDLTRRRAITIPPELIAQIEVLEKSPPLPWDSSI